MLHSKARALSTRRVSIVLLDIAMFTLSWDVVANIDTGYFNIKIHIFAFALALLAALIDGNRREHGATERRALLLVAGIFVWLLIASIGAYSITTALLQVFRNLIAGVVPLMATLLVIQSRDDLVSALTWLVRGAAVTSVFGVYQLVAYYVGVPQLVIYRGLSGQVARISAFSYEPAYFAQFLLLAFAGLLARSAVLGKNVRVIAILGFLAMFLLVNARIVFLMIPIFIILTVPRKGRIGYMKPLFLALLWAGAGLTLALVLWPDFHSFFQSQIASIGDQSNASNDLRLHQYAENSSIIQQSNALVGVGPGNLIYHLSDPSGLTPTTAIANGFWQQALLDGGVPMLALVCGSIVFVLRIFLVNDDIPPLRILCAGWICVVVVGGAITSNFFAPQVWATLGVILVVSGRSVLVAPYREVPPGT